MSLSSICIAFLTLYVLYQLYKYLTRRISTNLPPGPMGLPLLGYLPFLRKDPHKVLTKLSKKYGSVYGLYLGQKYSIILGDYEVMKETLTLEAASDRNPSLFNFVPEGIGFIASNGEEWQEQRRFCIQALRHLGLGKDPWETLTKEEVKDFTEILEKHQGKPINYLFHLTTSVTNNIMSILIGRRLKKGKDDEVLKILVDFIDASFKYAGPTVLATMIPWLRKFLNFFKIAGHHKAAAIVSKFSNFVRKEVQLHRISMEAKYEEDFMTMYLDRLNGKTSTEMERRYFTETLLEGNVKLLYLGGTVGITTSLNALFLIVATYPDVQRKIHEELDEVIGKVGEVSYDDRGKFPYTFSVIMEIQRALTIVPLIPRMARNDFKLRGYTIPKGTQIVANAWAVHNDPNLWEEPEKFRPERFLSKGKQDSIKADGLVPFSIGKRQCPGEDVTWMEIFLYFVAVMQKFQVLPPEGKQINFDSEYGFISRLTSNHLRFITRD